jgi:uncharacterized membrane protein
MERVLRQAGLKSIILLVCLLSLARPGLATTVIIPSDDSMIVGARAIVRAKVLSVQSSFDDSKKRIFTYVTLRVQEVLKGQITERRIVLKQLGGQVGDSEYVVFGSPKFERGEKVLLYLDTWADGSLRVHQMFLGKFNIVKDPDTGQETVVRSSPDEGTAVLQSRSHGDHVAGASTESMELSAYSQMVRGRLAANLEQSEQFERSTYGDTPVLARPTEYDAKEAGGELQAQFTLLGPRRFFEPDSNQPVLFHVKQSGAPNSQVIDDVNAAMAAWSNVPGCALRVQVGGTIPAGSCYAELGVSGIVFDNCDGVNSASPGCASILAWGGFYSFGGGVRVINGTTFGQIRQGFVSFNPFASCHFGNHCDVQEIATHELGHALGLNHSQDSNATMAAFAHFDGRCASIKTDDADGIKFIYPGTGAPSPLTILSSSPLPNATSNSPYSTTLTASGGTSPYIWSITAGALPAGLSLSGNQIAGTPTATGTFNFTVQVRDSAAPTPATAEKAFSLTVSAAGTQYDSQFVSQSVPTSLQPGQPFNINMKWLNTGTLSWNGANLYVASQNPELNRTWGGVEGYNAVSIGSTVVAPGQQLDITFTMFAPTTPGTYNFQWQTFRVDNNTFFGQMSTNVAIQVGSSPPPPPTPTNDAAFVSQSVATSMTAGQSQAVSVTMRNTGTTTWAAGSYKLGSQNPQDTMAWGLNRVTLGSSVAPGAQATFNFNITAPATAGTYNFQWRMLQDGAGFFGAMSTNVPISVASAGDGGGSSGDQATFISQLAPLTMTPGQTYQVRVTMKNTGTTDWTLTSGHKLGSQNPQDNAAWGLNRVNLSKSIPKGAQWTFTFNVRAPSTPGTYNFQWQMCKGSAFFGQKSTNLTINVGSSGGTNDAAFESQSVATSMTAGQSQAVSVTMRNTGTTTWAAGSYKLGSQNPQDTMAWGLNRVTLGSSVAPGAQATFNFNITAPATAGTYNFQWRMLQDGAGFFGAMSTNVPISVASAGGGGFDSAAFVSQSVPTSMNAGQNYPVVVTMKNNGTTTWAAGAYMLGSQNPQENMTWGINHVVLLNPVAPNSDVTLSFNVRAPSTPGSYSFQWQMMQDGAGFFGATTPNTSVSVTSPAGTPPVITTTSIPFGKRGFFYSALVSATGGTAPYSWSMSGAPAGLSINRSTGQISGTPTVVGTFNISVTVTDSLGLKATRTYKVLFQ